MFSRTSAAAILVTFTTGLASGCGQASPLGPEASAAGAPGGVSSETIVFALAAGALTLESPNGSVRGTYTGEASGMGEAQSAGLAIVVTEGTGQFAGASGTLTGAGNGAFVDEGPFSITLRGSLQTDRGARQFRASMRGTSRLSCREGTIVVLQSGSGTATALGRVSADLQHDIAAGAGCEVD